MVNHPNRRQIRLSLSLPELEALVDVVLFAKRQGFHPFTEYAAQHGAGKATVSVAAKVEATWEAMRS